MQNIPKILLRSRMIVVAIPANISPKHIFIIWSKKKRCWVVFSYRFTISSISTRSLRIGKRICSKNKDVYYIFSFCSAEYFWLYYFWGFSCPKPHDQYFYLDAKILDKKIKPDTVLWITTSFIYDLRLASNPAKAGAHSGLDHVRSFIYDQIPISWRASGVVA